MREASLARDHRRLAAIVSADVVGYSLLMGRDDSATLAGLKAHRQNLIDPKIAEHGGRIVKTTGDGLLLEFPSVVDAVRCAVDVQRGMAERNTGVPQEKRIDFRIGINVGDIIIDGDDIFGDGVNVAARLEALAEPGGICVSRVVRDQVLDKLSFAFEDIGAQKVKNIARPVEAYRVNVGSDALPAAVSRHRPATLAAARRVAGSEMARCCGGRRRCRGRRRACCVAARKGGPTRRAAGVFTRRRSIHIFGRAPTSYAGRRSRYQWNRCSGGAQHPLRKGRDPSPLESGHRHGCDRSRKQRPIRA